MSHIQNSSTCIVGDSQGCSHIQRYTRRTHRTQNIVLLTAKICHSDTVRKHHQIIRGEVQVNSGGIHGQASLCSLSLSLIRGHIQCSLPSTVKMKQYICNISAQGSPLGSQSPRFLLGASHAGAMFSMYQNSRRPKVKQALSIIHIICTSRHSKPSLSVKEQWELTTKPSSQTPAKGKPC